MSDSGGLLRDDKHPMGSPLLGRVTSKLVCSPFGHDIVVMDMETWDEEWLACATCGARFMPADTIDEDTEVIRV